MNDQFYIKQTIELAKKGIGYTNPNPMVGCVIVKYNKIISTGYHKRFGADHAEVAAIKKAKVPLEGAVLYVNLEPCSHFGKTPPCTDAIIKSGITRVVIGALDPNSKVNGQAVRKLKSAGIDVAVGVLESESRSLNEQFFAFHEKNRPFVALKFAASLDGKIATRTGDSKWITSEKARKFTRSLRGNYQSILVGINTIIVDNPNLGTQAAGRKDLLRIILDSQLRIPLTSDVLRDSNVLIVTTDRADVKKEKLLLNMNVDIVKFRTQKVDIRQLLNLLKKRGVLSILVEGGGAVLGNFVDLGLFDKVYAVQAPVLIGGVSAPGAIGGVGVEKLSQAIKLKNITRRKLDDNMLTIGYI